MSVSGFTASTRPAVPLSALFLLVIAGSALNYGLILGSPAFRLDDAYIVLHNAMALWDPDGSFAGTPPLEGSTSLLHTLAVAMVAPLAGPAAGLMVLSWLALFALGAGALAMAKDLGLRSGQAFTLALVPVTSGHILFVQLNGLETGWMMAATMWNFVFLHRGKTTPGVGVFLALLPFVRPELAVLSGVAGFWLCLRQIGTPRRLTGFILAGVTAFSLMLAIQFWLSGTLLPATGEAKRLFFATGEMAPTKSSNEIGIEVFRWAATFMGPVMLGLLYLRGRTGRAALVFALGLTWVLVTQFPNIATANGFRYLYFLVPVATLGLALGMAAGQAQGSGRLSEGLATATVIVALSWNGLGMINDEPGTFHEIHEKQMDLAATAAWIDAHADPDTPLLIHDIGYMAYATEQPLWDIVGLKTAASRPINAAALPLGPGPALGRALTDMLAAAQSCQILVSTGWNKSLDFAGKLEAEGWRVSIHPEGHPPMHLAYLVSKPESHCAP